MTTTLSPMSASAARLRLAVLCGVAAVLCWVLAAPDDVQPSVDAPLRIRRPAVAETVPHLAAAGDAPQQDAGAQRAWPGTPEVLADPFLPLGAAASTQKASTPVASVSPKPAPKVAASAPPAPVVAAAPTIPPLPFQAIGSISGPEVAGGASVAFLMQHEQMLVVKVGDTLAGTYRVDAISAQQIDLIYLPAMLKQSLRLQP